MMTARLRARCPSVQPLGQAKLDGFEMAFNKRSVDGSGKAGLTPEGCGLAFGAAFQVSKEDLDRLDAIEGPGYRRVCEVRIQIGGAFQSSGSVTVVNAVTYLPRQTEPGLAPFDWYLALILAGYREHDVASAQILRLQATQTRIDPVPHRATALEARSILSKAGF